MYGYALANGAIGVYNGLERVWRAKVSCGCLTMCVNTTRTMLVQVDCNAVSCVSIHCSQQEA